MYSVAVVTRLMGAEDAFVRCMFRISVAKTKVLLYVKFNDFSDTLDQIYINISTIVSVCSCDKCRIRNFHLLTIKLLIILHFNSKGLMETTYS